MPLLEGLVVCQQAIASRLNVGNAGIITNGYLCDLNPTIWLIATSDIGCHFCRGPDIFESERDFLIVDVDDPNSSDSLGYEPSRLVLEFELENLLLALCKTSDQALVIRVILCLRHDKTHDILFGNELESYVMDILIVEADEAFIVILVLQPYTITKFDCALSHCLEMRPLPNARNRTERIDDLAGGLLELGDGWTLLIGRHVREERKWNLRLHPLLFECDKIQLGRLLWLLWHPTLFRQFLLSLD